MPSIKSAPAKFTLTLNDLFEGWVRFLLPDPTIVEEFHHRLYTYLNSQDPLFLLRYIKIQDRGHTVQTLGNDRIRWADNTPSWWIHYQLFNNHLYRYSDFNGFIESTPCHIFDIKLPDSINHAGWHVAHILNVKDKNVDYLHWNHNELVRRMVRNIHPCNYFYLPKPNWQSNGANPEIIGYFQDKYRSIYSSIWADFQQLAGGKDFNNLPNTGSKMISILDSRKPKETISISESHIVEYKFTKLCFKADIIEPLEMQDRFRIITPLGTFEMTKHQFYEVFSNVVKSSSYQDQRIYHYPTLPKKALPFRVEINR